MNRGLSLEGIMYAPYRDRYWSHLPVSLRRLVAFTATVITEFRALHVAVMSLRLEKHLYLI